MTLVHVPTGSIGMVKSKMVLKLLALAVSLVNKNYQYSINISLLTL